MQFGGSQLMLAHASAYFRALLRSHTAEGQSGRVSLDPDFSSAAHGALLRQLHAMGEAQLPAEIGVLLELLCLAAKVRAPSADRVVERLLERCEVAVLSALDGENCFDILVRLEPTGEFEPITLAAQAAIVANLEQQVARERWRAFRQQMPALACDILEGIALKLMPLHRQAPTSSPTALRPTGLGEMQRSGCKGGWEVGRLQTSR
jgi:hypothetical protein